ncbi:hypothetical protein [Chelatococcus sp. XZ-Ab1]|uniref:hypothetical protein n=1 Tax=Chelatococcus sp. XZ-Ab1 TaxID=3034027 RepID=UPI0023E4649F|nr:hypothetical protein [Chelatococcus sp. XZ-Ab1]
MTDLLGPASAINAVTTRPGDTRVFGENDSWFKPCTSPSQQDGTRITADFLNGILAQIRRAIVGMGVSVDNADDDMLLKAIQAATSDIDAVTKSDARANMLLYPEVVTPGAGGRVSITSSTGQVLVGAIDVIIWRGVFRIDLSTFAEGSRTFATSANKVYHLRWHASGTGLATPAASFPNGRLVLRDLADAGYNPATLAESHAFFDSAYDDALLARVSTNPSNVPTVTALANLNRLFLTARKSGTPANLGLGTLAFSATQDVNWSRTPQMQVVTGAVQADASPAAGMDHIANAIDQISVSRYVASGRVRTDWRSDATFATSSGYLDFNLAA